MTRRLVAYSDRFSAHPGERVAFKVNAMGGGEYRCDMVRLRCGDHHPDGPGFQVMRPSRQRMYGHPRLIAFIESLGAEVEAAIGAGLLVGDLAQAGRRQR